MKWLDKLERKYGRFGIPDLMMIVSTVMVLVYLFDILQNRIFLQGMLSLNRAAILNGQLWRLVSFIFAPPPSSALFVFVAIYFYLFLGRTLESHWGSFRFTLYYLFGMLGCIAAAMLTGYGTNSYLNLSLFLAFAFLYPDLEVLLFFFLPIKVKYLAYLDWAFFALTLLTGTAVTRAAALFSLLNFFLFFGPTAITQTKEQLKYRKLRQNFRKNYRDNPWR